eukprot:751530-Hanusia_phi.AAC.3
MKRKSVGRTLEESFAPSPLGSDGPLALDASGTTRGLAAREKFPVPALLSHKARRQTQTASEGRREDATGRRGPARRGKDRTDWEASREHGDRRRSIPVEPPALPVVSSSNVSPATDVGGRSRSRGHHGFVRCSFPAADLILPTVAVEAQKHLEHNQLQLRRLPPQYHVSLFLPLTIYKPLPPFTSAFLSPPCAIIFL